MGDTQTAPPGAERMVLVDAEDRRVVLIELRLDRGASPDTVRRRFRQIVQRCLRHRGPTPTGAGSPPLHAVRADS